MHRCDVHVGNVDGHLGDVFRQPPANSLNCLQSAGLVISPAFSRYSEQSGEPALWLTRRFTLYAISFRNFLTPVTVPPLTRDKSCRTKEVRRLLVILQLLLKPVLARPDLWHGGSVEAPDAEPTGTRDVLAEARAGRQTSGKTVTHSSTVTPRMGMNGQTSRAPSWDALQNASSCRSNQRRPCRIQCRLNDGVGITDEGEPQFCWRLPGPRRGAPRQEWPSPRRRSPQ